MRLISPVASVALPITPTRTMVVHAVGAYTDPLKQLILAKTQGGFWAAKQMGQLAWQYTPLSRQLFDFQVPIPLHWTRRAWRGYNQSEVMAYTLSSLSDIPTRRLLRRKRRTRLQASLDAHERPGNVADVFAIQPKDILPIEGKRILLVDDLMTTGATLAAAAKLLLRCKAESVTAVVVCRVV